MIWIYNTFCEKCGEYQEHVIGDDICISCMFSESIEEFELEIERINNEKETES